MESWNVPQRKLRTRNKILFTREKKPPLCLQNKKQKKSDSNSGLMDPIACQRILGQLDPIAMPKGQVDPSAKFTVI